MADDSKDDAKKKTKQLQQSQTVVETSKQGNPVLLKDQQMLEQPKVGESVIVSREMDAMQGRKLEPSEAEVSKSFDAMKSFKFADAMQSLDAAQLQEFITALGLEVVGGKIVKPSSVKVTQGSSNDISINRSNAIESSQIGNESVQVNFDTKKQVVPSIGKLNDTVPDNKIENIQELAPPTDWYAERYTQKTFDKFEISSVASFKPVQSVIPYLKHTSTDIVANVVPRIGKNINNVYIFAESEKLVKPGLHTLRYVFDPNLISHYGLENYHGIPMLSQLQFDSYQPDSHNIQAYVAGRVLFFVHAGLFDKVLYSADLVANPVIDSLQAPFVNWIRSVTISLTDYSLPKAVYYFPYHLRWFKNYVENKITNGDFNYTIGKVSDNIVGNYGLSSIYAVDSYDQFTAQLLNFNAQTILDNTTGMDYFKKLISTYTLLGTRVTIPSIAQCLSSFVRPNVDERLRSFVSAVCLYPTLYGEIIKYHADRLKAFTNFQEAHEPKSVISSDVGPSKSQEQNQIAETIDVQRAEITGMTNYCALLAMEIIPPINYLALSNSLSTTTTPIEILVNISKLALFAHTWPGTFMRTIGFVQNWWLQIICEFHNGTAEATNWIDNFGIAYRGNPDDLDSIEFKTNTLEWEQSFYADGWLPILHGFVYFNSVLIRDGRRMPGVHTKQFCSLFTPIGQTFSDSNEAKLLHPRLMMDPKHFIPYPMSSVNVATNKLRTTFRAVYDKFDYFIRNAPTGFNKSKTSMSATQAIFKYQFTTMVETMAFCMQAQIYHWMRVMANTSLAVLYNWVDHAFDSPYPNWAIVGEHIYPMTSSSSGISPDQQNYIDYACVYSFYCLYHTSIVASVPQLAHVTGGPGVRDLRLVNNVSMIQEMMAEENSLHNSLSVMSFALGILDLLKTGVLRLPALVYDLYQNDVLVGTLNTVTEQLYDDNYRSYMMDYGWPDDRRFVIDATTTVNQLTTYLSQTYKPRVFVLEDATAEVQAFLLSEMFDGLLIATGNQIQAIFVDYFMEPDPQEVELSLRAVFLERYPDLDLNSILDPENKLRGLANAKWQQFLTTILNVLKLENSTFMRSKQFVETIKMKYTADFRSIRRVVRGSVQPFDETKDPKSILDFKFGISNMQAQRMSLIKNMFLSEKIPRIHTGLIIGKVWVSQFIFNEIFPEDNYQIVDYTHDLFGYSVDQATNRKYSTITINGVTHTWNSLPSPIIVSMNMSDVSTYDMPYLIDGVRQQKCYLKVLDVQYTFSVTSNLVESSVDSILKSLGSENWSRDRILHVEFIDTQGQMQYSPSAAIDQSNFYKCVFPMEDLSYEFTVIGLGNTDNMERPDYTITNIDGDYDTGPVPANGVTSVKNRFTTQNGQIEYKTDSTSKISTSNFVTYLHQNIQSTNTVEVNFTNPLYDSLY